MCEFQTFLEHLRTNRRKERKKERNRRSYERGVSKGKNRMFNYSNELHAEAHSTHSPLIFERAKNIEAKSLTQPEILLFNDAFCRLLKWKKTINTRTEEQKIYK